MPYHPEATVIRSLTRVNRERRLPHNAAPIPTHTIAGMAVDAIHVVLQGDILRDYRIIDVTEALKLRSSIVADEFIQVQAGQRVQFGHELARRGKGRRSRVVMAPADGEVIRVDGGRIVLQISERSIEIPAKIPGEIENVESRSIQIASNGSLIQCAWGNGGFCYETFRFLPEGAFMALSKVDVRISEYRRVVIISPYPITKGDLLVAQQQEAAGVVAPSMPSNLREFAMQLTFPVLLTEGFGQRRPTGLIYTLLQSNMGRQAAFDATTPNRWSWDRPEIMIPLPAGGMTPSVPTVDQAVEMGMQVRIMRAPWDGLMGEVVEVLTTPQTIENGLRLPCARVQLPNGREVLVPLANIELTG